MSPFYTLWKNGSKVNAALTVKMLEDSGKAVRFQVADNEKMTFWVPAKALVFSDPQQIRIAFWFTPGDFMRNVFDRYANHYNR